ncbi:MAG: type II toxin-antitoxin system RelB/DinJ family antitoxin [Desulfovibrionaceae bacterium]|nr:type II toxin-antitoxin system RelB/DinJ family antitoxin [Desulfovibrionaceae bacterium]
MSANVVVRARIDPAIKEQASAVLADWGLTVSDAFRMMMTRIAVDKCLPFGTEEPNKETREALEAIEKREGLYQAKDADDLFRQLGI